MFQGAVPWKGRFAREPAHGERRRMVVAFARENNLARIVGEKAAGRLLSATSVKVDKGFRLALPTGAYYIRRGSILRRGSHRTR